MMVYATDSFRKTITRLMDVGVCWHYCQQTFFILISKTMNKKERVIGAMKPKTAHLGFSKDELEGVAERIAGNLTDEATDEEINAQIDAVMPYLELSQKAANRVISQQKPQETGGAKPTEKTPSQTGAQSEDERIAAIVEAAVAKATQPFVQRIETMETTARNKSFVQGVQTALKDVDAVFYAMALEGREFKSQEEADKFVEDVKTNWQSFSAKTQKEKLAFSLPAGQTSSGDEVEDVASFIRNGGEQKK